MILYLAFLLGMVAVIGRDAWFDRTPRASLAWWAHKRTEPERENVAIAIGAQEPV